MSRGTKSHDPQRWSTQGLTQWGAVPEHRHFQGPNIRNSKPAGGFMSVLRGALSAYQKNIPIGTQALHSWFEHENSARSMIFIPWEIGLGLDL